MANSIGKVGGGYEGLNPYINNRNSGVNEEQQPSKPVVQPETNEVSPDTVMDMLAANANIFVQPKQEFTMPDVSDEFRERIAGFVNNFEITYSVAIEEFGPENEELIYAILDNM